MSFSTSEHYYIILLSGILFPSYKSLQLFFCVINEVGFLNAEFTVSLLYLQTTVTLHDILYMSFKIMHNLSPTYFQPHLLIDLLYPCCVVPNSYTLMLNHPWTPPPQPSLPVLCLLAWVALVSFLWLQTITEDLIRLNSNVTSQWGPWGVGWVNCPYLLASLETLHLLLGKCAHHTALLWFLICAVICPSLERKVCFLFIRYKFGFVSKC